MYIIQKRMHCTGCARQEAGIVGLNVEFICHQWWTVLITYNIQFTPSPVSSQFYNNIQSFLQIWNLIQIRLKVNESPWVTIGLLGNSSPPYIFNAVEPSFYVKYYEELQYRETDKRATVLAKPEKALLGLFPSHLTKTPPPLPILKTLFSLLDLTHTFSSLLAQTIFITHFVFLLVTAWYIGVKVVE